MKKSIINWFIWLAAVLALMALIELSQSRSTNIAKTLRKHPSRIDVPLRTNAGSTAPRLDAP